MDQRTNAMNVYEQGGSGAGQTAGAVNAADRSNDGMFYPVHPEHCLMGWGRVRSRVYLLYERFDGFHLFFECH